MAHPVRIKILEILVRGGRTVQELQEALRLEQPIVSQQLAVLRNRNIVFARKVGANVYYSVSDKTIFKLLDAARDIFNNHLIGIRSMLEEIHTGSPARAARR